MPGAISRITCKRAFWDDFPRFARLVMVEHVCGIALRNPRIVEVSRDYGPTGERREPPDP